MTVVYTPAPHRYVVRQDGVEKSGHHTFEAAKREADRLHSVFLIHEYDVIDKLPDTVEVPVSKVRDFTKLRDFIYNLKPWWNAKPGEVWLITLDGEEEEPAGVFEDHEGVAHFSLPGTEDFSVRYPRIVAGRRIWPEGETK